MDRVSLVAPEPPCTVAQNSVSNRSFLVAGGLLGSGEFLVPGPYRKVHGRCSLLPFALGDPMTHRYNYRPGVATESHNHLVLLLITA